MRFFKKIKDHFVPSHDNAYRPHVLRRRSLMFLLALALLTEGALVANLLARQSGHDFLAAIIQGEIISLTNDQRASSGVGTLIENPQLDAAAQAKANDMAARGYFSHVGPDGTQPWGWIEGTGYDYQYAGENLAVRFVDSKDVVNAWMASPTHRANLVKGVYTEIGVAVAEGTYKGQPATFVVQYFGKPSARALSTLARGSVLGAGVGPSPSFTDTLARSLSRLISEPRATTAWVLGGIISLLALALAFAFFRHIQIQAHDLLLPGAAVAVVAAVLIFINNSALPSVIHDAQAASVANAILLP